MSILNTPTRRRDFFKASAGLAGVVALPATAALSEDDLDGAAAAAQIRHIQRVLQKQSRHSSKVQRSQVETFAREFTAAYGVVDYQALYSGLHGEYRLTRLFVYSLHKPA